jgi:Amt family ammonium transporter
MLTKLLNLKSLATLLLLMVPSVASAQDLSGGNTAWILTSTALVLLMTLPGLSLFYGGLVRTKNVLFYIYASRFICF